MERTGEEKMTAAGCQANTLWTLHARPLLISLLAALACAVPARAQQPDDDDAPAPAPQPAQPVFADENFDQWVFQNQGSFADARRHLDTLLALQVEDIDRACKLSEAQKKKLLLSGRGDIKRFFNLYDKAKQKFQLVKNDQQKFQEIWQEISPLQNMLQFWLFNDDSFFLKSLHNTIASEQFQAYEALSRERRTFRHRANVELAVMMIEINVPLRAEQRRELITFMTSTLKPYSKSPALGYYVMLFQLSELPEEKVKPLFDDAQWKPVRTQIDSFKQMKQWLKQSGQLPDDEDTVKAAER